MSSYTWWTKERVKKGETTNLAIPFQYVDIFALRLRISPMNLLLRWRRKFDTLEINSCIYNTYSYYMLYDIIHNIVIYLYDMICNINDVIYIIAWYAKTTEKNMRKMLRHPRRAHRLRSQSRGSHWRNRRWSLHGCGNPWKVMSNPLKHEKIENMQQKYHVWWNVLKVSYSFMNRLM